MAYRCNGYHSAIKRNKVLMHTATWVNLENVVLSERNQTQKDQYCMTALVPRIRSHKQKVGLRVPEDGQGSNN